MAPPILLREMQILRNNMGEFQRTTSEAVFFSVLRASAIWLRIGILTTYYLIFKT